MNKFLERFLSGFGPLVGILAIIVAFFGYAFFWEQPCDIDKQYLWCHTHPMGFWSYLGITMFVAGALWLGGIVKIFGKEIAVAAHSSWPQWVGFIVAALGAGAIWLN